jgi:hypothetical protein
MTMFFMQTKAERARTVKAGLVRHHGPDHPSVTAADAALRTERLTKEIIKDTGLTEDDARRLAGAIVRSVDSAPALSPAQLAKLQLLLNA